MDPIKNEVNKAGRWIASKLWVKELKDSVFLAEGKLTTEEFVIAGDALIERCPTWSWETGKNLNKSLPDDKQFLIIREVPCKIRAKDLIDEEKNQIEETEDDDGWVIAENKDKGEIEDLGKEEKKEVPKDDDDDEIEDVEINSDSDDDDENIFAKKESEEEKKVDSDEEDVVRCRRYNISLTYDTYYKTPRLWLQGYDENKKVLEKEIFDDVMAEHAKKTVTLEKHTILGGAKQATIHP